VREEMKMSMSSKQLRELSDEELFKQYDQVAQHTSVGLDYYTEEIARRRSEKSDRLMLRLTIFIAILTAITTLATIVNVVLFIL
jgi:hypothetical protein